MPIQSPGSNWMEKERTEGAGSAWITRLSGRCEKGGNALAGTGGCLRTTFGPGIQRRKEDVLWEEKMVASLRRLGSLKNRQPLLIF
ncbi:MAG: hypothetical protein A2261_02725 [Candidatus Magasanikbacteria bacterium RIFOXYA2_FULL_44_8]|uniref:Uncharacterized protein n=1 Tax=Candidatus Magasanikbacteria bacterium RIFOXYA2_FULL_44_8 TaxID=1798696 RepID=A0A1F6NKY4_9BACT|nr:MAG: hypothetical protein A2261_02725 [Candidatus Magasanikbacteria bacterium RIFOXYA2_FULL_44_8]